MDMTDDTLCRLAHQCSGSILNHPRVGLAKDNLGWSSLLILASRTCNSLRYGPHNLTTLKEILNHPDVVLNSSPAGDTPLHLIARHGREEIFQHQLVHRVKNNNGNTPLDVFFLMGGTIFIDKISHIHGIDHRKLKGIISKEDYFNAKIPNSIDFILSEYCTSCLARILCADFGKIFLIVLWVLKDTYLWGELWDDMIYLFK